LSHTSSLFIFWLSSDRGSHLPSLTWTWYFYFMLPITAGMTMSDTMISCWLRWGVSRNYSLLAGVQPQILHILASQVSRITGVSHLHPISLSCQCPFSTNFDFWWCIMYIFAFCYLVFCLNSKNPLAI
jgi:hypothetical protein